MIKFNERFSAERDNFGWILRETKTSTTKTGDKVLKDTQTYAVNFEGVCAQVIDRSIACCDTVEEALAALKDIKGFLASEKANAVAVLVDEMEADE